MQFFSNNLRYFGFPKDSKCIATKKKVFWGGTSLQSTLHNKLEGPRNKAWIVSP